MSEETYEFQCMRAELLGLEKPSLEEFERKRAERLKQQQEELDAAEAQLLEEQDETLNNTGGKLDELNTILSSTQQKLNRFKQTACTSLSNIFSRSGSLQTDAVNPGKEESETNPSTSGANTRRNTTACTSNINPTSNITDQADNEMLEPEPEPEPELEQQHQPGEPVIPIEKIRAAKDDVQKKMTSHLHKLDSLINKADQAEISMAEQTKQMRKMTK
uniref:t-SNARE coiled-coil homology domain-containing protein n=1 Tax=Glossina austeni TaxID=7395 RepID=A0A1A9VRS0_GLOAU